MQYQEFEEMRKKAILYDTYIRSGEIAENFRALIEEFNAYEDSIRDSTKRMVWLDPKDKKVKRVKKLDTTEGSNLLNLIKSKELRETFLQEVKK